MDRSIKAIETMYAGYRFRSRLEAKWAVFFDLCGWKWSYEPIDCNGWIPDFALGETATLVEIKPAFELKDFDEAIEKILYSGWEGQVVLLGADPCWWIKDNDTLPVQVGWLLEPSIIFCLGHPHKRNPRQVNTLQFGVTFGNGRLGLATMSARLLGNVTWKAPPKQGVGDVWPYVRPGSHGMLAAKWAEACNVSRWVPTDANRKRTARS